MESLWWIFALIAGFAMLSLISHERQRENLRIAVEKQLKEEQEKSRQEEPVTIS